MGIELDTAKDAANLAKHGLSPAVGRAVLEEAVGSIVDARFAYGEVRAVAFGLVAGRLHACVYALRGATYRIISVRRANRKETARWLS